MNLTRLDPPLLPKRGIVLTHTKRGSLSDEDICRWIRLNRLVHRAEKIDILLGDDKTLLAQPWRDTAEELHVPLSLRTRCETAPPEPAHLRKQRLFDVCLSPVHCESRHFDEWLRVAHAADLAVRVQIHPPFPLNIAPDKLAATFAKQGVVAAYCTLGDPLNQINRNSKPDGPELLAWLQQMAAQLQQHGIEANIAGVPFCMLEGDHWPQCKNDPQLALDHNYYEPDAYRLARQLFTRRPYAARRAVMALLARHTHLRHPADDFVLPWLLERRVAHILTGVQRRLTAPFRRIRARTPQSERDAYEKAARAFRHSEREHFGPICGECSFRRICDRATPAVKRWLHDVRLQPQDGELKLAPDVYSREQLRYVDPIDQRRMQSHVHQRELAEQARALITNTAPTRTIRPEQYAVENAAHEAFEGSVRWFALRGGERTSTPLARLEPPFALGVDIAGGYAEFIGFRFGRRCLIACPTEAFKHSLLIYVNENGEYVLLRDGRAMPPLEFPGQFLPPRLGRVLEPRISLSNIEEHISTYNVRLWELGAICGTGGSPVRRGTGFQPAKPPAETVTCSILIVSTRFTRRLQAVLRCIAHQRGFPLERLEVVVAYVPGIDPTDDLLDSMAAAYPNLRVVRSPFAETNVHSKGFMINESLTMTSGEWITLLDADTLLPPDFFAALDGVADKADFVAPDGRKLLSPETTAKILLGDIAPWEAWDDLLATAGEFRHREAKGIPVGFCQCVRRKHLETFPYIEMENFEWADMDFGLKMRQHIGREHRLSGHPVLHLDHGSSQWFGTTKQY